MQRISNFAALAALTLILVFVVLVFARLMVWGVAI